MLSILGTDFIAHWAYEERISAHAQPAVKCELFYMYNICWAYAERILSHTEHTRNEFYHILSILGTDFIACWACAEMFKSRISLPIRIWFLKISCYRPLGPYGFGFCKKSKKKNSCLCTFKAVISCLKIRMLQIRSHIFSFSRCEGTLIKRCQYFRQSEKSCDFLGPCVYMKMKKALFANGNFQFCLRFLFDDS
jgi:hypothetical protein